MSNKKDKPTVKLSGQDGNVFNLIAICSRELKRAGLNDEAKTMTEEIFASGSYDEALQIMMNYVDVE